MPAVYQRLWRFCLVLTSNRATADDLAQSTAERALARADSFQAGTDLDRWLFTIARRLWLNDLRAAKIRTGQGIVEAEDAGLADERPHAEVNIFAREVFARVQTLPEGQRMAVLLVYVEGYSYREAADLLDVPIGTVMSRLSTARRTVSDAVGELRLVE